MDDLLQKLQKAKPCLSITGILKRAFSDKKDVGRVRNKIDRGSPDLTVLEAKAILATLDKHGITLEEV